MFVFWDWPAKCRWGDIWVFGARLPEACLTCWTGGGAGLWRGGQSCCWVLIGPPNFLFICLVDCDGTGAFGAHFPVPAFGPRLCCCCLAADVRVDAAGAGAVPAAPRRRPTGRFGRSGEGSVLQGHFRAAAAQQNTVILRLGAIQAGLPNAAHARAFTECRRRFGRLAQGGWATGERRTTGGN